MTLNDNDLICPVCGRAMRLLTITRRVPGQQTFVLQCRLCGLSATKTVDAPGPDDTIHQHCSGRRAADAFPWSAGLLGTGGLFLA
jgi:hypothetical protein